MYKFDILPIRVLVNLLRDPLSPGFFVADYCAAKTLRHKVVTKFNLSVILRNLMSAYYISNSR